MFDFETTKKFCFKPTQISCSDILIYRKLSNAKHLYGLTFGNGKPFHHKFSGHFQFETWENTGIIFTTGFCVFIDITHPFHLLRAKMTQKMMIEIPGLRDNKYYIHIVSRCKVLRYHLKKILSDSFVSLFTSLNSPSWWFQWGKYASTSDAIQSLYSSFNIKEECLIFASFLSMSLNTSGCLWLC